MAMELDHSFTAPVPPAQAWDVLLDVQQVAPCMPGATVDAVDGDDVAGRMKVKVGPVSLTYRGTATATVKASLQPENGSDATTLVTLHTTLNVTGRPAQFGRGVIAEVGSRLIDKFADNLAQQLASGTPAAEAPVAGAAETAGSAETAGAVEAPVAEAAGSGTVAAESVPAETASVPVETPAAVRTPTVPSHV